MNQAIEYLTKRLNNHLKQIFGLPEDIVIAGRLVDSKGSVPMENQNKLVLSIVNITAEEIRPVYGQKVGFAKGEVREQQLVLNLDLLLTANFSNELEAARFLTAGIQIFHEQPYFTKEIDPTLPFELNKVTLEMQNLSLKELEALWGAIGTSMLPAAMYKVRTVQTNS